MDAMDVSIDSISEGSRRESLGGLSYDITLKPAGMNSPFAERHSNRVFTPPTLDDLDKKMSSADARRQNVERRRQEQAIRQLARVDEKRIKAAAEAAAMLSRSQDDLQAKEARRLALLASKQARLQEHALRGNHAKMVVSEAQEQLKYRLSRLLETKESTIRENKVRQMNSLMDKLKEHEQRVKEVRQAGEEMVTARGNEYAERHMDKMQSTLKKREALIHSTLDKLRDHNIHINLVRQKKEQLQQKAAEQENME